MIFSVSPSQIKELNSEQLVELLKKLLYAEAQRSGISLRGVSVPLQITVADGGEDARISWTNGLEQTNYLPSRFCIFQAKATDPGTAGWKQEVWTKSSKKSVTQKKLNEAVAEAIAENASYIGFTSAVLIGSSKYKKRIEAIKEGIREAGADPEQLKTIKIYDANKIADWVSLYPAIAIWLNEKQSGLSLKGFQTVETWGQKADIVSILQVEDKASRFFIGGESSINNSLTFDKVKERIADFLANSRKSVRVIGSSGLGKTRFVYEVLRDENTIAKIALKTSAIYCDFRDIGSQIFQIVQAIAESKNSALLIVDECPRDTAVKICEIVTGEGSNLKVITIGNDNQPIEKDNCLNISVTPADDYLIEGIIRQRYPNADYSDVNFIKNISAGYPRIAVLATNNYSEGLPILKSIEDVVERILSSCYINRPEQVRAIECLALFKQLGADKNVSDEIDFVAEKLARQTGDEMYEHLAFAAKQNLIDYRNPYFALKLQPIVAFLGTRRLDLLRAKTIIDFIENASPSLRKSFLSQWCYFSDSKTAATVAQQLLARDAWCGSLEKLKTDIGSQCLNAIVHIEPDSVADTIRYLYKDLPIDNLKEAVTCKQEFVQVLSILVSRKSSFYIAGLMLMRFAALENQSSSSKVYSRFKQLFQLYLSGTEAEPSERFAILDQGISSGDERIILVCIEVLENTLKQDYFSGLSISNHIGNQPPLKDWIPKIWAEVFDFNREGLQRLYHIRYQYEQFADKCEKIIANSIRSLLCEYLFDEIENILLKISKEKQVWLEAIEGVGDWLYYDRNQEPEEFSQKVRKLYDKLMPTEPIQQALLFTKFWTADINDPELSYEKDNILTQDFEYSSRKAEEIAAEIAKDKQLTYRAIQIMVREELNNVFPFAHELAMRLEDPVEAFQFAVNEFEASSDRKGIQFIRGLIAGIDKKDTQSSSKCIDIALKSDALKDQMVNIYTAVNISVKRLNEIVESVKQGSIPVTGCVYFSYGQGLHNLSAEEILPFIDELAFNHGSEGMWTSLEIISTYQHHRKDLDKELAKRIKQLITSQELLEKAKAARRDGNLFEWLILLIKKYYAIEDEFAIALSNQVIRLCQVEDYQIFSALDDSCRNIIRLLVKEKPSLIWDALSRFFETATPSEISFLKALVEPEQHFFDGKSHNKEGILFGVSNNECKRWAKVNPEIRVPFLCIFYPMVEIDETGHNRWHPALESLTHEFGAFEEFRLALERRIHPSSWSGSIIPYLETYLIPLQTWFKHPVIEMSVWAREMYLSLERRITRTRNRGE